MKSDTNSPKSKLRNQIAELKKQYTTKDLFLMSEEVFSVLEITGAFQDAKTIFIYNSLPDEVSTNDFIERWKDQKTFILPIVSGKDLKLHKLSGNSVFKKSEFGINEPIGENFTNYREIDLAIIPGVAFDRKGNRLGRGKGFYDRLLPQLSAPKMGICFDFQLSDTIPTNDKDIKMDIVVSENDLIW